MLSTQLQGYLLYVQLEYRTAGKASLGFPMFTWWVVTITLTFTFCADVVNSVTPAGLIAVDLEAAKACPTLANANASQNNISNDFRLNEKYSDKDRSSM